MSHAPPPDEPTAIPPGRRGRRGHPRPPDAAYSHHPQIIAFRDRLYATWSLGAAHEDDPGQQMVLATSDDGGRTWSRPVRLSPAEKGEHAEIAYTAEGIRAHGGKLIAYYGRYEWLPLGLDADGHRTRDACVLYRDRPDVWVHRGVWTEARVSDDAGKTWSAPRRIIDRFVPNLRPFPLAGGRLIMPGNVTFAYTDDPAGLTGWRRAGLPRLPADAVDDPEGFHKACHQRGDPIEYCEGSFYQTDDGTIHMMLRTGPRPRETDCLAVTESRDAGATWSEPMITRYADCRCRFQFGHLPDGRFFGLSCPAPRSGRTPMVLAVSRDGVTFGRHFVLGDDPAGRPRMPGMHKGGRYGYPSCAVAGGAVHVIYSVNKEDIWTCRFGLDTLKDA